ncbi:MAG: cobyrinate a,c-diamide synthase [Proteobacteria bacterium]|nr:cobyrinate a,c-diamide synthase [Pseudomonadota bacterium]
MTRGIVIAGTNSGCGKTSVSLGLMAYLKRSGYTVAPFKVGPDYIDPGHHNRVTGRFSRNLDGWMLTREYNKALFERATQDADIAVVEGVMGLYDGYDGKSEMGSTAQMAKWLDLPVILVVNAQSMARSGAALVKGFERFDPSLNFAGVIFNKLGSPRHLSYLKEALEGHVAMPCLGGIYRNTAIEMPERHLGLVTDDEKGLSEAHISTLADMVAENIDVDRLLKIMDGDSGKKSRGPKTIESDEKAKGHAVRIGIARDRAFCFYYQDNLDILQAHGAELVFFSPMMDGHLPENLDGLYLGGGYPELFAKELSANQSLRNEIKAGCNEGLPIYGECGGFMYLCQEIRDFKHECFSMTGCFPFKAVMLEKLRSLGYREVTLNDQSLIGHKGQVVRGHEFHYSRIEDDHGADKVYRVSPRTGDFVTEEGYRVNRTLGSYIHLHFGSCPDTGRAFVAACMDYRQRKVGS